QPHAFDGTRLARSQEVVAEELKMTAHRVEWRADLMSEGRGRLLHQGQAIESAGPFLQRKQGGARLIFALPLRQRFAQLVVPAREQSKLVRPDLRRGRRTFGT